jgi:hypothetical protein
LYWLVNTAVVLKRLSLMGPIPAMRFKWRIASFVGDNEIKTGLEAFIDAWTVLKFSIGANQYLLDARWQAASYSGNKRCGLFTADGLSLAKPAQQVLAGLLDKTQYGPISLNLISAKTPPNRLSCSLQVSYTVEALIFLALSRFPVKLCVLRFS